jgi:sugar lactone lactonase YvrE
MADTSTNFRINSAFSPSYDITWSFNYSLCGDTSTSGGFSTFLFEGDDVSKPPPKYAGLGFATYGADAGVKNAVIGVMFTSNNVIEIKTGTKFDTLTTFSMFKQLKPFISSPKYEFKTIRFNLTDLAQTLNISIKDPVTDRYEDVLKMPTGLIINPKSFYKIGFGASVPIIAGDNPAKFSIKDILVHGSLNAPTTKISDRPPTPKNLETFYIIQSPFSEKILIGKPAPDVIDGALLWSNGTNLSTMRLITGTVNTLAGSDIGFKDDASVLNSQFNNPSDVVINNDGDVFVVDSGNNRIRKISSVDGVTTLAGGTTGDIDDIGINAQFDTPNGIVIDSDGNLFVTDTFNHKIRKITPSGEVSTFAGSTAGFTNGNGTAAKFNEPIDLVIDKDRNLYITDSKNYKIRKITPSGDVSTFTGTTIGFSDGSKAIAKFNGITGICIDDDGNLYVTDTKNFAIRKIDKNGKVGTIAGGIQGYKDGKVDDAEFNSIGGINIDYFGNLYVTEFLDNTIRKIDTDGNVSTFAGGVQGKNDGFETAAEFDGPADLAFDSLGSLYVADYNNGRIRKIT